MVPVPVVFVVLIVAWLVVLGTLLAALSHHRGWRDGPREQTRAARTQWTTGPRPASRDDGGDDLDADRADESSPEKMARRARVARDAVARRRKEDRS